MAWLRRLDGQTKTYTISPALLYEKLARQEGLVSLWDLQDILISAAKGMPLGYVFPRSGTVVIDDAHRAGAGQPAPGRRPAPSSTSSGATKPSCWRRGRCFGLPARTDLPPDSVPALGCRGRAGDGRRPTWIGICCRAQGPAWMSYWDQHVRGTGKR